MLPPMPELPDVTVYIERLEARCAGKLLEKIRIVGPSLLRSVEPPIREAEGKQVVGFRRLGKRIVFELEADLFLVFHLMIAGRFRWRDRGAKPSRKLGLAAFDFPSGTLLLTEASPKKRATLCCTDPAVTSSSSRSAARRRVTAGAARMRAWCRCWSAGITQPSRRS